MHEKFRGFCWTECANGAAFVVATADGSQRADAMKVLGKRKCCWSRTPPIVYGAVPIKCANPSLPDVFHGSQWASLHRPLVEHIVRHPLAQKVLAARAELARLPGPRAPSRASPCARLPAAGAHRARAHAAARRGDAAGAQFCAILRNSAQFFFRATLRNSLTPP